MDSTLSGCDFVAGWISGICGIVIGHPFDTAKVWAQTIPSKSSTKNIVINIFKTGGIKGFYQGMLFPMVSAGALNSLFFGAYGNTLRLAQDYRQVDHTVSWSGKAPYPHWHWDVFLAGCIGGLLSVVISCPVELIKTQMQTQTSIPSLIQSRPNTYSGPWACLLDQCKHKGIRGIYRGLVPVIWRDVGSSGVYMSTYAHSRELIGSQHTFSIMMAGGLAGVVSWISIVPLDVIKNRVQADSKTKPKYKGMIDCAVKSYRKDGFTVFFRGVSLITLRAMPVNAVTFVSYEFVLSLCK